MSAQLDAIAKKLQKQITEINAEIEDLKAQDPAQDSLRVVNNSEDEDAYESEAHARIEARLDEANHQLDGLRQALAKVEQGTYGKCQRCGKDISPDRLAAMPTAIYDVECEEIIESGRR